MPVEINASIQQQSKTGPVREIQILGGKEVRVSIGLKSRQKVYHVSLLALADKSHLRLHIAKHWLWMLIMSVVSLVGYAVVKSFIGITLGSYEFPFYAVVTVIALLSASLLFLQLTRKRVFFSRKARVPLFDILVSNPDHKSYKAFLNTLNEHIQKAREFWQLKPDQQVAGEMKMLRRLASEGVITQRDYERAKNKLFTQHNKK